MAEVSFSAAAHRAPLTLSTNAGGRIDTVDEEIFGSTMSIWHGPFVEEVRPDPKGTPMRKLTTALFSSIDGVVQSPDQWQPGFDDEMGAAMNKLLDEQDTVLLGRVTFEEWAGYWPTSTDEPFASWINGAPKYVASTTLTSVDAWQNSTLIPGSVTDFVADLKQQAGGTIGTAGSPTLVRTLLEAGLVDELVLMISPVVAGNGLARLFPEDAPQTGFALAEAQGTTSGCLIATYCPITPGG